MSNYKATRDEYAGSQITEISITRVGGATDGVQVQSNKITTNAQATYLTPYRELPLAIWNDVTGTDVIVTVYGTINLASLPLNDEIWLECQYLGGSTITSSATWDVATVAQTTLSGGNLVATNTGASGSIQGAHVAAAAAKSSGKYYFEITLTTVTGGGNVSTGIGTSASAYDNLSNSGVTGSICYVVGGGCYSDGINRGSAIGSSQVSGDVVCIAVDLDNRMIWWRKGAAGNWNGNPSGNPATNAFGIPTPASVAMVPFVTFGAFSSCPTGNVFTANFGATSFVGAVPSGFTPGWTTQVITPPGSFKSTSKSHPLAAGAAVAADSSTWNNAVTDTTPVTLNGTATNVTLSGGNLTATHSNTSTASGARSTSNRTSGKYYFEVRINTTPVSTDSIGILQTGAAFSDMTTSGLNCSIAFANGIAYSSDAQYGPISLGAWAAGDVISCAIDFDAAKIWFRRNNGLWQGTGNGDPVAGTVGAPIETPGVGYTPAVAFAAGGSGNNVTVNFGATGFAYSVPTGFKGWFSAWTPFKLTATLTAPQPQQRGYIYARILAAKPSTTYYIDPKVEFSSTGGSTSGTVPFKATRDEYAGSQVTETSITRTGGASAGGTSYSDKITTNTQATFLTPYRMLPMAIWNEVTGADVTVTVYGTINSASLPLNDELWLDVQYLGSSSSPLASFKSTSKSHPLAAGAAVASDSSTWNGTSSAVGYATLETVSATAVTLSGGSLVATNTGTTATEQGAKVANADGKVSGKYYFELTWTTITGGGNCGFGIGTFASTYTGMSNTGGVVGNIYYRVGEVWSQGSRIMTSVGARSAGQTSGCAIDLDNRKIWFRDTQAGSWNHDALADPATNTNGFTIPVGAMVPYVFFGGSSGASGNVVTANFGASAFTGTVPSGFTSGWPLGSGPWISFKLTATLTSPQPQQKGYIYANVRAAKASATYYVDPLPVLS